MCFNVGPALETLGQHQNNIGSKSRVHGVRWGT